MLKRKEKTMTDEKGNENEMTRPKAASPLEKTRFSTFFDFTVLQPHGYIADLVFYTGIFSIYSFS